MSRFTFDPTFADGSPRRWAGTHRPPFDFASMSEGTKHIYGWIYDAGMPMKKWSEGYFDKPIYFVEADE